MVITIPKLKLGIFVCFFIPLPPFGNLSQIFPFFFSDASPYLSVMQPYLRSDKLSTEIKKLLFKLRTRMFPIKSNFSSLYKNSLLCSLCKSVKFEDIFNNEQKQEKVTKVFKQISDIYERNRKK